MHPLDNHARYEKLDPKNVRGSVAFLAQQCDQAWEDFKSVKVPASYRQIDRICINGMGGSALGGDMIRSVYDRELPVPLDVVRGYSLPNYVNARTLCILSSYSGTTEEVLATCSEALRRKAKVFAISAGGALADWARAKKVPHYEFDARLGNPSGQPRMGLGYSVMGQLALFSRLGLIRLSDADARGIVSSLQKFNKLWGVAVPFSKNSGKQLAAQLQNKVLNIAAAEHLLGNAHVWANQTNETAKTLSDFRAISELNHHLLEGLAYPAQNRQLVHFLFLESALYAKPITVRFGITKKVLRRNKIGFSSVKLTASHRLGQAFEALLLGSYVTLYQGLLNGVDPAQIPWVDYFKRELSRLK